MQGPVLVVGAGLLGTSIGLALSRENVEVVLQDVNAENVRTATGLGAGRAVAPDDRPALVVVAVPPDHLADEIAAALMSGAVVSDVGSVKQAPLDAVREQVDAEALTRYVGSHPLAGSERSGPLAASANLFDGRPWAVTPHEASSADAVASVTALAETCGATVFTFTPEEHDRAVARTSHLPHLLAALVAGRLAGAPGEHLALSGQGVRDVTRIAAGDPGLWQQIVTANRGALGELLREVRDDLDRLMAALESNARRDLATLLEAGNVGTAAIPGKHGGPARAETGLFVAVPDHPGELARLLSDVGEIGVNIEDLRIDHDPGRPVGLVELTIAADSVEHLQSALAERGWSLHG